MAIMKSIAASLAVASIALCAATPVYAATNTDTDWGAHAGVESSFVSKVGFGKFVDTFSFNLSQNTDLLATLFSAQTDPSKGNFSGKFRLFSGFFDDGLSDAQIGSTFSFNKNAPTIEGAIFAGLLPGSYYYELQGELSKVGGTKFYALNSVALSTGSTPPVPEPETYAMLLAGLGVVTIAARRRIK